MESRRNHRPLSLMRLHDGLQRPTAFAHGMYVLDPEQSCGEADAVRAYLDTYLALVDPGNPTHWTTWGQWEGERHRKGAEN